MVPIHDTDIAEERWSKAEWSHYELWEKVEKRLRKNKRRWIAATVLLFLGLSSIPIIKERSPKWRGLSAARKLADEINWIKREAGIQKTAFRLRLSPSETLSYTIEKTPNCADVGTEVKTASLVDEKQASKGQKFFFLSPDQGSELDIPGLINQFCYDPLLGHVAAEGDKLLAIGVINANDLTEKRLDRVTLLLLNGPSAEISLD